MMFISFKKPRAWLLLLLGGMIITAVILVNLNTLQNRQNIDTTVNSSERNEDMVNIKEFIPGIAVDLVYSTPDNIHGQTIYNIKNAYLRRGTAVKLKNAQEEFVSRGYRLKVWDAYRPPEAQFKLWEIMPDTRFVVNPWQGFSYHSRGVAIDVTLLDENGKEISMPSGFDDFTARADRDYTDVSPEQALHAQLLEEVMAANGLKSIYYEWWHFTDSERDKYEVYDQVLN